MSDKTPASRQLLNITKAMLDNAEAELATQRNTVIEECAQVAASFQSAFATPLRKEDIAAAIRALKEKP